MKYTRWFMGVFVGVVGLLTGWGGAGCWLRKVTEGGRLRTSAAGDLD
jgi:hypothetical protein